MLYVYSMHNMYVFYLGWRRWCRVIPRVRAQSGVRPSTPAARSIWRCRYVLGWSLLYCYFTAALLLLYYAARAISRCSLWYMCSMYVYRYMYMYQYMYHIRDMTQSCLIYETWLRHVSYKKHDSVMSLGIGICICINICICICMYVYVYLSVYVYVCILYEM